MSTENPAVGLQLGGAQSEIGLGAVLISITKHLWILFSVHCRG